MFVCVHTVAQLRVMISCASVLHVYFSGKPRAKEMESTQVFCLPYSSSSPAALKKFSFSFCLSLYAIAVHHTQSFSACSIYNIAFSILSFEGCNLTLRSSGQAVLSVDAAIKKKTLCPGSAEFCCPHAAPPPLPAVVPVRMKALDALWSFSLSPLTSELMIALVGGGDVMLSCPLPQLHRTRVHSFSVFTPSKAESGTHSPGFHGGCLSSLILA